jgi:DNA-directed RNA polymerase II subunit RPB2
LGGYFIVRGSEKVMVA